MTAGQMAVRQRHNFHRTAGMGLPCPAQSITNRRAGAMGGELFSESGLQFVFLREGFLPMTKSIALSLVLAASLGLAACSGKGTENAANNAANAAENASNAADNAMNAALNAADNAANAASNATNNAANAM
jgi:hypothetical protein